MKKKTTEIFIEEAIKIHGTKYDYSKVEYKNSKTKVCIICPIHGEYMQAPNIHLKGSNCPKCTIDSYTTTRDAFIERVNKVHNFKYNYLKVDYKNAYTKVCIICREHGEFYQTPNAHLRGQGCPKCSDKKITREEFIERANKVHNFKYNYSKVEFVTLKEKVCIICPIHGEFYQEASIHLYGSNCPKCVIDKNKLSKEEFIERFNKIHNFKFDYSKVEYKNSKTKVCIICPVHGEFFQIPSSHLSGLGCSKCSNTCKLNTIEFIEKAKKIHGGKYNYSKVNYKGTQEKVCIICPEHGEFYQTPNSHLGGMGCGKCGGKYICDTKYFIEKAKKIHGEKYDYSKVNYKHSFIDVEIICPVHGSFFQKPMLHLRGSGCQKCSTSSMEKEIMKYCENNQIEYVHQYRNKWLKRQSLDFYFPKFNVGVECQGIQHFKPVEFFGNEKAFRYIQKRDIRKNKLCKENGIKLFYFTKEPYSEFLNEPLYKDTKTLFNEITQL